MSRPAERMQQALSSREYEPVSDSSAVHVRSSEPGDAGSSYQSSDVAGRADHEPSAPPLNPAAEGYSEAAAKSYNAYFQKKYFESGRLQTLLTAATVTNDYLADVVLAVNVLISSELCDLADKQNKYFIPCLIGLVAANGAYLFKTGASTVKAYNASLYGLREILQTKNVIHKEDSIAVDTSVAAYAETAFNIVALGLLVYSANLMPQDGQFEKGLAYLCASVAAKSAASTFDWMKNSRLASEIALREITEVVTKSAAQTRALYLGTFLAIVGAIGAVASSVKKSQVDNNEQTWPKLTYGSLFTVMAGVLLAIPMQLTLRGNDLVNYAIKQRFTGDVSARLKSTIMTFGSRADFNTLAKEFLLAVAAAGLGESAAFREQIGYLPVAGSVIACALFAKYSLASAAAENNQQAVAINALTERPASLSSIGAGAGAGAAAVADEEAEERSDVAREQSKGCLQSVYKFFAGINHNLFFKVTKANTHGGMCNDTPLTVTPRLKQSV